MNENIYKDSLEVSTQEILDERILLEEGNENSQTRVSHIQLSFSSEEEKKDKLNTAVFNLSFFSSSEEKLSWIWLTLVWEFSLPSSNRILSSKISWVETSKESL